MRILLSYLSDLLRLWIFWLWFLALDIIGLLVNTFYPDFTPPQWIYLAIPVIGFVIANFVLYKQLRLQIAERESYEANIHLQVKNSLFSYYRGTLSPSPFPELKIEDHGLQKNGLPGGMLIIIDLEGENIGHEPGELVLGIDRSQTNLTNLFALKEGQDQLQSIRVDARKSFSAQRTLFVDIIERDAQSFAQALRSVHYYQVVGNYWTKRIGGNSEARTLAIKGDFDKFRQNLIQHWESYSFSDLANIARGEAQR
jgi:hypothetical protein